MKKELKIEGLLDLSKTLAAELFTHKTYPWEVLSEIGAFIEKLGPQLPTDEFDNPAPGVWIAKDANVFPSAYIGAPCIIDHEAEIRHCAFIRGSAIVGKKAVVGNSTELKNCILFEGNVLYSRFFIDFIITGISAFCHFTEKLFDFLVGHLKVMLY